MIERDYNPILLGFVVDVSPDMLLIVKNQLISVAGKMESDEKAYIYHPNSLSIPRWPGESVAAIANYKHLPFKGINAVKKILDLWSLEDPDTERLIFYITNFLENTQYRRIQRLLQQNAESAWMREPVKFFLLNLGNEDFQDCELNCIKIPSPDWIASQINQEFRRELVPFLVKNYCPLDVDALKAEYEENKWQNPSSKSLVQ
jgi:hypothetical protein